MNKSPAFQFYANDWLSSTAITLMTPACEGAYIHLICHAWNDPNCSIPDNDAELAILSRLGEGWFNGGSTVIRKCFQPHPTIPGKLVNFRLLKERERQLAWKEKSIEGGKKSAKLRESQRKHIIKGGSKMVATKGQPKGNSSSSYSFSSSSSFYKDKINIYPWLIETEKEWDAFCKMRLEIKKPISNEYTAELAIKKLEKFKLKGHDPGEILDNSTLGKYQGLFEPKGGYNGTDREPRQSNREIIEAMYQEDSQFGQVETD